MSRDIADQQRFTEVVVHLILVVEDDPDTAQFLKVLLEEKGYQVKLAKDGGQAHSMFVMRKPDFVILDLILPGESGFEICERFKQSDKFVPVLILSAIELEDSREFAKRIGADGYITKPFDPAELLEQIPVIANDVWTKKHGASKPEGHVRFYCACGKKFKVSPAHRGKSLTCPECGEAVNVPLHD